MNLNLKTPGANPFDKVEHSILEHLNGSQDVVPALFATTMARESGPGRHRRQWLLSIEGLTADHHDAILAL